MTERQYNPTDVEPVFSPWVYKHISRIFKKYLAFPLFIGTFMANSGE